MCLASHLASHRAGNLLDGTSQSEILRSMLGTAPCAPVISWILDLDLEYFRRWLPATIVLGRGNAAVR